jgi:ankyrin repeat protein
MLERINNLKTHLKRVFQATKKDLNTVDNTQQNQNLGLESTNNTRQVSSLDKNFSINGKAQISLDSNNLKTETNDLIIRKLHQQANTKKITGNAENLFNEIYQASDIDSIPHEKKSLILKYLVAKDPKVTSANADIIHSESSLRKLLDKGLKFDDKPLIISSKFKYDTYKKLIKAGLNLNSVDKNGKSLISIMLNAREGFDNQYLMDLINNPQLNINYQDPNTGNTVLHDACKDFNKYENQITAQLMLSDPEAEQSDTNINPRINVNLQNNQGDSALSLLAKNDNTDDYHILTANDLLRAGAKPNLKNNTGDSACTLALMNNSKLFHTIFKKTRELPDLNLQDPIIQDLLINMANQQCDDDLLDTIVIEPDIKQKLVNDMDSILISIARSKHNPAKGTYLEKLYKIAPDKLLKPGDSSLFKELLKNHDLKATEGLLRVDPGLKEHNFTQPQRIDLLMLALNCSYNRNADDLTLIKTLIKDIDKLDQIQPKSNKSLVKILKNSSYLSHTGMQCVFNVINDKQLINMFNNPTTSVHNILDLSNNDKNSLQSSLSYLDALTTKVLDSDNKTLKTSFINGLIKFNADNLMPILTQVMRDPVAYEKIVNELPEHILKQTDSSNQQMLEYAINNNLSNFIIPLAKAGLKVDLNNFEEDLIERSFLYVLQNSLLDPQDNLIEENLIALANAGLDINYKNNRDQSLVDSALALERLRAVKVLNLAKVNFTEKNKIDYLKALVNSPNNIFNDKDKENKQFESHIKAFKNRFKNLDFPDSRKQTALIHSIMSGDVFKTSKLIEYGADLNKSDYEDTTVAHHVAQQKKVFIRKLLNTGLLYIDLAKSKTVLDSKTKDGYGQTPIDIINNRLSIDIKNSTQLLNHETFYKLNQDDFCSAYGEGDYDAMYQMLEAQKQKELAKSNINSKKDTQANKLTNYDNSEVITNQNDQEIPSINPNQEFKPINLTDKLAEKYALDMKEYFSTNYTYMFADRKPSSATRNFRKAMSANNQEGIPLTNHQRYQELTKNESGSITALHLAVEEGNINKINELLDRSSLNQPQTSNLLGARDQNGRNVLAYLLDNKKNLSTKKQLEILEILKSHSSPDDQLDFNNQDLILGDPIYYLSSTLSPGSDSEKLYHKMLLNQTMMGLT